MNPFYFHTNIPSNPATKGNESMDCPFCGKEDHFFFNTEGQWDCKRCGKEGNLYTFLNILYETCTSNVRELSEAKGIPKNILHDDGVRYNPLNQTYVIPHRKLGKINNLYKYVPEMNKILATPSLTHSMYDWPETSEDVIWLVEGHSSKWAGLAIVGKVHDISVICVPGANTFKESFAGAFAQKHVVLFFDNDEPGENGRRKAIKYLTSGADKPLSIKYIEWKDKPPKYDLRAAYLEYGRKAFKWVSDHLIEPELQPGALASLGKLDSIPEDETCDSFDKLLDRFRELYYTTEDMELGLLLVLTSIYSIKYDGEQIWVRLIGPPGSAKTSIAKCVSASSHVVLRSTFKGLFSGWRDESDEDAGLIPLIAGKTLVVKDADALLQQPNVAQIFSEMRDFYDKDSTPSYRNRVHRDYRNIRSTFILCGTNALRRADNTYLGERFLDFEMHVSREQEVHIYDKVVAKAQSLAMSKQSPEIALMSGAKGFIKHLMSRSEIAEVDKDLGKKIIKLCWLAAKMRTKVDRDRREEITFHPQAELASRLIGQFIKLAICAPIVAAEESQQERTKKLIVKCVRDIIDPQTNRFQICTFLTENPGSTPEKMLAETGIQRSTLYRNLDDLRLLKVILARKGRGEGPGRKSIEIYLREEYIEAFDLLEKGL